MSKQFGGSFEGLDNRRDLWKMLDRVGEGLPREMADVERARLLGGMLGTATSPAAAKGFVPQGLSTGDAYFAAIGIAGVLGADMEQFAIGLDRHLRGKE
jgi:hypothetical protein